MLEVLQFIFSGVLRFFGFLILFTIFCGCLSQVTLIKIVHNHPKEKEEPKKVENVSKLREM